jgi:WD40 repeat protein
MSAGRKPSSPYKGLNAFEDTELDALLFFGRERETEIVVANLIASRLTVLYGPSGVGKSSLLSAAVARSLRALPEEPLVVVFSAWSDDPQAALSEAVSELAGVEANGSAVAALSQAQSERDVYLILDQAEEYFLYHAEDGGPGSFAEAFPAIFTSLTRVNVLISLREDSLAKLDRFAGRVPGLFGNTLRLDRLDRNAARSAVLRPVERFAELTGEAVTVEPALVEHVLAEVGAGQIEPALGGLGTVEGGGGDGARIEAPYLQLVMQRLWDEERAGDSTTLRAETVARLGGARHIVEEHLEGAMDELTSAQKDIAAQMFNHLVTPSGTKIAHEVPDLADFGRVSEGELQPVLSTLADRRILRSVDEGGTTRFEIFHDVLGEPVLAWRAAHEAERELSRQKEASDRRHRQLLAVIAGGAILLAVMSAVTVYALSQRGEAREQARAARASGLVAAADAELERDPELSLLLAREAARASTGERVARSLRRALLASRVRGLVEVGEPLVAAVPIGDSLRAATAGGDLITVAPDGRIAARSRFRRPLGDVSFADDGTAVVTTRAGEVSVVGPDGKRSPLATGARGAAISPDGTVAAIIRDREVQLVAVPTGTTLHTYPHPAARSAAISGDNRRVLTGGADDLVRVWSGQSGRRIHDLTEHAGSAVAVAYSPDGEFVASVSTDGTGRIWRTSDWGLSASLTGHTNALTNVMFSADGEHIVTTGKDGTARVSHVDSGEELFVLPGHRGWVESAAFAGGAGSAIVTSGTDGEVRTWDGVFQPELDELAELPAPVTSIAVDESGVHVRTSAGREHTLSLATGDELATERVPKRRPRRVVGPEGTSATIRGRVVRLLSGGEVTILRGHRNDVTSASFSPLGALLATGSRDQVARIWDLTTHEVIRDFQHNTEVRDAQFSPDGRWLVTSTLRASVWDLEDGTNLVRLQGHEGPVTAAAFDLASRRIVTGGADGTVRTYLCEVCGDLGRLVALAEERLAATRRELTAAERLRYLD